MFVDRCAATKASRFSFLWRLSHNSCLTEFVSCDTVRLLHQDVSSVYCYTKGWPRYLPALFYCTVQQNYLPPYSKCVHKKGPILNLIEWYPCFENPRITLICRYPLFWP